MLNFQHICPELKKTAEQLKLSNKELEEFVFIASHDLQEPLRKISTFATRLKEKHINDINESGMIYLHKMISASSRMRTLLNDLLTYSRITSKTRPFEKCELKSIVSSVLSDFEDSIKNKGARIEVGKLNSIQGDQHQLEQL